MTTTAPVHERRKRPPTLPCADATAILTLVRARLEHVETLPNRDAA